MYSPRSPRIGRDDRESLPRSEFHPCRRLSRQTGDQLHPENKKWTIFYEALNYCQHKRTIFW